MNKFFFLQFRSMVIKQIGVYAMDILRCIPVQLEHTFTLHHIMCKRFLIIIFKKLNNQFDCVLNRSATLGSKIL